MKIIVDAFGGDYAPDEIIKGCALAVRNHDVDIVLIGDAEKIKSVVADQQISFYRMKIKDVKDVITMDDDPMSIAKEKLHCTMAEGLRALVDGEGDAFVSAGNSGALAVGATLIVKRIKGIRRIAFAPILPKDKGHFMLIDSGANMECRPEMLKQFGVMGSAYMSKVMKVKSPRVGLANVGTESHKGGELQKKAYELLSKAPVNFVGNVEARDIPVDAADVVVADGFTGNMILKTYEGVAKELLSKIKSIFLKNIKTKVSALMLKSDFIELKKTIDYNELGGAPLLGALKPIFKIHGNAKAKAVNGAIGLTKKYVERRVIDDIQLDLKEMKEGNNNAK